VASAVVIVASGWGLWAALGRPERTVTGESLPPARVRQQEILREAIGKPGDPELRRLFQEINARHFAAGLPPIPVRWEPRLREVGELAEGAFTLEGMFGHVGDETVILLNTALQNDPAGLQRTLSHEMVHAYLHSIGDPSTDHGPAFQAALRRLAGEGAFPGIAAGAEDRSTLRAWLEAESTRLEAEHQAALQEGVEMEQERARLEDLFAALTARAETGTAPDPAAVDEFNSRRQAYDDRVDRANRRAERGRADVAAFNRQVERYRLMMAYPDGLDSESLTLPRTATAAPVGHAAPVRSR
jgi:hypothetical protein